MPEWIICDLDGNELSVDLTKTSINSVDDVKEQFKKFNKQSKTAKKKTNDI